MSWPLKMRVKSFAIIVGVVMMESLIALVPLAAIIWMFTQVNAGRLATIVIYIAGGIGLIIAVHGDLGRQGYRKWWRTHS